MSSSRPFLLPGSSSQGSSLSFSSLAQWKDGGFSSQQHGIEMPESELSRSGDDDATRTDAPIPPALYSTQATEEGTEEEHSNENGGDLPRAASSLFASTALSPSPFALPHFPSSSPEQNQHSSESNEGGGGDSDARDGLRAYMLSHSIKGRKIMQERTRYIGAIMTIESPDDPEVTFGIRRVGNRERIAHQDHNATTRYIQNGPAEDGSDSQYTIEKDYPVGTMKIDTIVLCLATWNISEGGHLVPVTRENIIEYTSPAEFDFLYNESIRINPILLGEAAQKKDSSASSSPS